MKQYKYSLLIVGILAFFSLPTFGQAGTITFSQYCAAGSTFSWPVNIREAKPVRITYAIDVTLNSDNFAVQEGSVNTYPVFMTNGYVTGSLCAGGTTGIVYISLYVNTSGYKTVSVQYCADNPIITSSNLNVGGNATISGTSTVNGATTLNGTIKGNALGGALRVQSSYGYIDIGPQNGSFANIYTNMGEFAFDKPLDLVSGLLTSYTNTNLTLGTGRGTPRMTILNSNGNVGIGTITPRGKLEVLNGSPNTDADPAGDLTVVGGNKSMGGTGLEAANLSIQTNDGNNVNSGGSIGFGSRYNGTQFANYAAIKGARDNGTAGDYGGYLIFGTRTNGSSTTERMRITSGGYVGIGTTTPSSTLSVYGGITKLTSTSGVDGNFDNLIRYGYKGDLESGSANVNRWHGIDATITAGTAASNKMKFRLYAGGTSNTAPMDVMTLQGDGTVGIGTTNPQAGLHVTQVYNNTAAIFGSNWGHWTYFGGTTGGGIRGSNEGYLVIDSNPNGTGDKNLYLNYGTSSNIIMANGGGNVGIGTGTIAPDALLTVNGIIHAKEVKIEISGAVVADYVFKPNYKLMPLSEVKEYVKANSHLPEIPSAAEVGKNGMNIGEMQNKLLQKVEELTLYSIQQQEEIQLLKSEIQGLKNK